MGTAVQGVGDGDTRIKVFVSYSRADKAFANDLVLGLAACGFAPYIDRQDIAAGEDWEKRLEGLIAEADSVVYIVSPDSLASDHCGQEFAAGGRAAQAHPARGVARGGRCGRAAGDEAAQLHLLQRRGADVCGGTCRSGGRVAHGHRLDTRAYAAGGAVGTLGCARAAGEHAAARR